MYSCEEFLLLDKNEAFNYLINHLNKTNRTPEYFVNWEKVIQNVEEVELYLHSLNYLIGKRDIYKEAIKLFRKYPYYLSAIPVLIASREKEFPILQIDEDCKMSFMDLNFNIKETDVLTEEDVIKHVEFMKQAGLLDFLQNRITNNLVDYVYGIEVGLDSNGRKNRSGTMMEEFVKKAVEDVCSKKGFQYMEQASVPKIQEQWGYVVPTDKLTRRFDFAINNHRENHLYLIEVNYYGGGGSKLKSVAGEFTDLAHKISSESDNITFIWITDGMGWNTAKKPLQDAFNKIEHVLNLKMLETGYLDYIIR